MNTNKSNLFDHDYARKLYDAGQMPRWVYVQLYATPEEAQELFYIEKKRLFDEAAREIAERKAREQAKREEAEAKKELQKQTEQAVEKAISELLKDFKQFK